jgi:hypothetical protein
MTIGIGVIAPEDESDCSQRILKSVRALLSTIDRE